MAFGHRTSNLCAGRPNRSVEVQAVEENASGGQSSRSEQWGHHTESESREPSWASDMIKVAVVVAGQATGKATAPTSDLPPLGLPLAAKAHPPPGRDRQQQPRLDESSAG